MDTKVKRIFLLQCFLFLQDYKLIVLGVKNGGLGLLKNFLVDQGNYIKSCKMRANYKIQTKTKQIQAQNIFEDVKHLDSQEIEQKT